uniref:Uncharacterized protein n=1 Tax=Avena sativa TaxID=4498 RepID=A0ACD5TAI8_AVESA
MEMDEQAIKRLDHKLRSEHVFSELIQEDVTPTREIRSPATTSAVRLEGRALLDALRSHREILRRETEFLRREVKSRGLATLAGKKAYMEKRGRKIAPPLPSSSESSTEIVESVGVGLPYLVTTRRESLHLLLDESHHLRYRIQSLASIPRKFSIPVVSSQEVKKRPLDVSRAAVYASRIMQICSRQDDGTSSRRLHRLQWESIWDSQMGNHADFDDITTLSPMHFTPCTPGFAPYSATICPALQIYSLKIVQLNVNLNWPLYVYGVVAARDNVDHNRNVLFYRSRANPQLVTEDDPFLRLTGPSRAIVSGKPVKFEVDLKIKYQDELEEHQSRAPISIQEWRSAKFYRTYGWRSMLDTAPLFDGYACSAELSLEQLPRAIQATIVSVRLVAGSWPPSYGYRVSCSLSDASEDSEVELLNCLGLDDDDVKKSPIGSDGCFALARNVVSAQLESTLKVVILTKSRHGGSHSSHVEFPVLQYCQTSKALCSVVDCKVEVVVAWSLIVKDTLDLMLY